MRRLPQSTAARVVFKVYLSSDHVSAATGKTVAVTLSKNGGAFGNPSAGATNATEIASGWYYVDLSTTDTGTAGNLVVRGTATACDDAETLHDVVNANTGGYAALPNVAAGASGGLPLGDASGRVDLGKWIGTAPLALTSQRVETVVGAYASGQAPLQPTTAGRTLDVSAGGEAGVDWANVGSPTSLVSLTGTAMGSLVALGTQAKLDVNAEADTALADYDAPTNAEMVARTLAAASYATAASQTAIEGKVDTIDGIVDAIVIDTGTDIPALLATIAGYIDTEVAAIKLKTDLIPSDPADASDIAAALSSLQTHGDSTWATVGAAAIRSAVGLVSANLDTQLAALPTAAENADAVWLTELPGLYDSPKAGFILGVNLDDAVSTRSSHSAADVWAVGTRALTDKAGFSLAASGLDLIVIESGINCRQAISGILASALGVLSGAATSEITIKGGGVVTARIVAVVDSDGNRTAVTLTLPT